MNNRMKYDYPVLVSLALGGVGLVLRRLLFALAVDDRGLLTPHHPALLALWAVTLIAAGVILLMSRGKAHEEDMTGSALWAGFGCFLEAVCIAMTVILIQPRTAGYPGLAWRILGASSAVGLAVDGYARVAGKKVGFLPYLVVCLFFVFHIVDHYRGWSSDPQMMNFLFALFGAAALALFAFYCAACCVGINNRRLRLGMGLAAIYFCVVELSGSAYYLLYGGAAVWVATTLMIPQREARTDGAA